MHVGYGTHIVLGVELMKIRSGPPEATWVEIYPQSYLIQRLSSYLAIVGPTIGASFRQVLLFGAVHVCFGTF